MDIYNESKTLELEKDCGDNLEIDKEIETKYFEKGKLRTCFFSNFIFNQFI